MYFYCICGKEGDLCVLLFRHLLQPLLDGVFKIGIEFLESVVELNYKASLSLVSSLGADDYPLIQLFLTGGNMKFSFCLG